MTYERPTQYKSSASERAHGFFTTKYGDAFEDDMTRGKLRNFRAPSDPDNLASEERCEFFREGAYPYQRKISLDAYYEHKFPLQIELVKMQNWVRTTARKWSSFSRDATPLAKGVRSDDSWSTSTTRRKSGCPRKT